MFLRLIQSHFCTIRDTPCEFFPFFPQNPSLYSLLVSRSRHLASHQPILTLNGHPHLRTQAIPNPYVHSIKSNHTDSNTNPIAREMTTMFPKAPSICETHSVYRGSVASNVEASSLLQGAGAFGPRGEAVKASAPEKLLTFPWSLSLLPILKV